MGKYLGMFLLLVLAISFTSGFLVAASSIELIGTNMRDDYNTEDGRIYFHSSKKGYKNDCIARDGRACFTVMRDAGPIPGSGWARLVDSVIIYGRMELVEHGEFHEEMTRRLSYRFTDDSDYIEGEIAKLAKATAIFALVPEHMRGKRVKEE